MKRISVIGAGGFGNEVYHHLINDGFDVTLYDDNKEGFKRPSDINYKTDLVLVAIGDPIIRCKVVNSLPDNVKFFTFISSKSIILDKNVKIGEGSIICAGSVITSNVVIGKHCQFNPNTTIAHDCIIGDYFTATPGVNISGNCKLGNFVYFGTNSCCKQKIEVCDNVTIGMNSGVLKNINESGVYIGTPLKKIKNVFRLY